MDYITDPVLSVSHLHTFPLRGWSLYVILIKTLQKGWVFSEFGFFFFKTWDFFVCLFGFLSSVRSIFLVIGVFLGL